MSNIYSYTEARKNLADILTRAAKGNEVFTIVRRNSDEDAVIMSKTEYDSIMETLHLFSSPANAERLIQSFNEAKKGEVITSTLDDLKKAVGLE